MTNDKDSKAPASEPKQQSPMQPPMAKSAPEEAEMSDDARKRAQQDQSTAKEPAREFRWFEWINLGLLIVGIIAVCIYGRQLGSLKKQTDILHTQQRAWISGSSSCFAKTKDFKPPEKPGENECPWKPYTWGKVLEVTKANESLTWWLSMSNYGQTPAVDAVLKATWCIRSEDPKNPPTFEVCASQHSPIIVSRTVAPPRGIDNIDTMQQVIHLTDEEIKSILSVPSRQYLYILERTTYSEWKIPEGHTTESCLYYLPHWIYALRTCEGGNRAD